MRDELTPDAQDFEPDDSGLSDGTGNAVDTLPSEDKSPAAVDPTKRQQDLLAQRGRELAAEKRRREQAEQAIVQTTSRMAQLEQQLARVSDNLSARDQAEADAYIASLPPNEQTATRIQMLEERLAQADRRTAQQEQQQQRIAYQRQQSAALIAQANDHFGVELSGNEPELDWTNEERFVASLRALGSAAQRYGARGEGADPVATKKAPAKNKYGLTPEQMEEIKTETLQSIGAGRSFTPRPVGGASSSGAPSEEDIRDAGWAHSSKSPGSAKRAIAEMRERAAKANGF